MRKNHSRFSREQRIQMKIWITVLGMLLLLVLLFGRMLAELLHNKPEPEIQPTPSPVIREYPNVWIMEAANGQLTIFRDGQEEVCILGEQVQAAGQAWREQVADLTLVDGVVTQVRIKDEKIRGKILSADEQGVVLEGIGALKWAEHCKGYRLFQAICMCETADLPFGYDFVDFVVEDGEVCAFLYAKEGVMESIRVLIHASDYDSRYHAEVVLQADSALTVTYGTYENPQTFVVPQGEAITFSDDCEWFVGERIRIQPEILTGRITITNLSRNQGVPGYRGSLELLRTQDGIVVINEVLLEEYLYSVVPSEMPSSYSEEALKAQAICARTYAYGHMLRAGYPQYGAHVDDSTSYQVYNNINEQERTTTAAKETYGQLLFTQNDVPAGTYYYSTSCGVGTNPRIWKTKEAEQIDYLNAKVISRTVPEEDIGVLLQDETAFKEFITSTNESDYESEEGWYRWTYTVDALDAEYMYSVLLKRYKANPERVLMLKDGDYVSETPKEFDKVLEITVSKRGCGGVADELILRTDRGTYKVITEHNIRYLLNNGESKVIRQDGSKVSATSLLPSGYFVIEPKVEKDVVTGYVLFGGGFGHGVGMSQNGAKHMALDGYTAEGILLYFYDNCHLKQLYES